MIPILMPYYCLYRLGSIAFFTKLPIVREINAILLKKPLDPIVTIYLIFQHKEVKR
jgi:hypothetical protein